MPHIHRAKTHKSFLAVFGLVAMILTGAAVPRDLLAVSLAVGHTVQAIPYSVLPADPGSEQIVDSHTRISFAYGTTSGEVAGNLAPQAVKSYILDAAWNQVMMVTAESADSKTILEITGVTDGVSFVGFSGNAATWKGALTRTQSYLVKVKNTGAAAADYKLKVEIPARIYFRRGAYSGSVFGLGSAAKTLSYVLWARAGQTMTVTLSSPTTSVYLTVDGASGNQSLVKVTDGALSWTGTLPQSQDYIVRAVQNLAWVNFTMWVTIR